MYWPVAIQISFKCILFLALVAMLLSILVEGIMRNISVNYFEFELLVKEMSFKDISNLEL